MPSVLDPPSIRDWDRQRDESPAQWFAFKRWRDTNCTFVALSEDTGVSEGALHTWARDWSWKLRKTSYDRWLDEGAQAAALVTAETVAKTHLTAGAQLREAGLQALRRLLDELAVDPRALSASAAVRAIAEGTKLERLTLGLATEITGEGPDYSKLSDEEFEQLRALQGKADGSEQG